MNQRSMEIWTFEQVGPNGMLCTADSRELTEMLR